MIITVDCSYVLRFLEYTYLLQSQVKLTTCATIQIHWPSLSFIKYPQKTLHNHISSSSVFIFLEIPPRLSWISRLSIETAPHRKKTRRKLAVIKISLKELCIFMQNDTNPTSIASSIRKNVKCHNKGILIDYTLYHEITIKYCK